MPEGQYTCKSFKFNYINEELLKEIFNRDELLLHGIHTIYAPIEIAEDMYLYSFVENLGIFDLIEESISAIEVPMEELFFIIKSKNFNRLNIP